MVVSSPTGSGKSTRVPTWCPRPVLVVEPRRVACRSLAQRVAELEGEELGKGVGYWVRDDQRAGADTGVTFATPGIALRIFNDLGRYRTLVLDELHERVLDVDLLLALAADRERFDGRLVAMSATLDGDRVAHHLGGIHLHAEGRQFPVDIAYLPGDTLLPDARGLDRRVIAALDRCRDLPGDVLVFLPGKGEIAALEAALASHPFEVIPLHGGLSLREQSRAFEPAARRKVILATNVAETSLTVPGVGVVIDSGLVRRTRYLRGRGHLALAPVARDSADQRAGRAGRTGPGHCLRLWSETAHLEPVTPPEIHRESLTPLVLAAAALGTPAAALRALPFLDPPREDAVAAARGELADLGALDGAGAITERGAHLFGLPLDPALGALLVAARERPEALRDMVDLVSMLAPGRRLFLPANHEAADADAPPTFETTCDAVALLTALRGGNPPRHRVDGGTLAEARAVRKRLEEAFELGDRPPPDAPVDRRRLALTALAADPGRGHVARVRGKGRRVAWSAGGTEIVLARESGVQELLAAETGPAPEALVVLDSLALGPGGRDAKVLATAAMAVPPSWLAEAGLGEATVAAVDVTKDHGRPVGLTARVERRYAGRVLGEAEETPTGDLARRAVAGAVLDRRLFSSVRPEAEERLEAARLAARMADRVEGGWLDWAAEVAKLWPDGVPSVEDWIAARVAELGVASGDDVALLDAGDLLPPDLPTALRDDLDKRFPRRLELPDAVYRLDYEPARRRVILEKVRGGRKVPPPVAFLPRLEGLAIKIRHKEQLLTLRDERGRVVGTSIT